RVGSVAWRQAAYHEARHPAMAGDLNGGRLGDGVSEEQNKSTFLIGGHPLIAKINQLVTQVGTTDATGLIMGESGTGKELVARSIHEQSPRVERPFIPVNCGAIPAELLESEMFGHERGAFTGAVGQRAGMFQLANGGTIFLDEVGEMNPIL